MEFVRFLAVGLVSTLVQFGILALGTAVLHATAPVASGAGYLAGSVVSYAANRRFTFSSDAPHGPALARFYAMVLMAWLLTMLLMELTAIRLAWNLWVAQGFTTMVCLAFNFVCARQWVFRGGPR